MPLLGGFQIFGARLSGLFVSHKLEGDFLSLIEAVHARAFDRAANLLGWMNTAPRRYPRADALRATLENAGLQATFTPLHGNTPFNNWLVVATKPTPG